jgi:uncharacterized protein
VSEGAIVDTGPLVAFLDRGEQHHDWACEQFRQFPGPLPTCEPVLTEALFLLRRLPAAQEKLLELVARRCLVVDFRAQPEIEAIRRVWRKYRDLPMSFADACLVCMAETTGLAVCTLDADFAVYRIHGRTPLTLIRPHQP